MPTVERMTRDGKARRPRSRLARFAFAVCGIACILAGAFLVILSGSAPEAAEELGFSVTSEVPGVVVAVLGFALLLLSGRGRGRGGDGDPDSHLTTPRDLRDRDTSGGEVYFGGGDPYDSDSNDNGSDDAGSDNADSDDD